MKAPENIVTKCGKSKLSDKAMSSLLYAIVMCKVTLLKTHGIGIYRYTKKQNRTHFYEFSLSIDESLISKFQELSGVELEDPISVHTN